MQSLKTNSVWIKKAIRTVNLDVLVHLKRVNEQVNVFNYVLINIFSNFVPNKIIGIDDRDLELNFKQKIKHSSYTKVIEWVLISPTIRTYNKIYQN